MGNCINRQSQRARVQDYSATPSPGSIPDTSLHWHALEVDPQELATPLEFSRIAELPDAALSMVPRFMDVPTLKNLRLSGSAGAALCRSYWVGDAHELQTVLDRFNPQGIDGMTIDGQEFTDAHLQMLPPTYKRLKFLNQQM